MASRDAEAADRYEHRETRPHARTTLDVNRAVEGLHDPLDARQAERPREGDRGSGETLDDRAEAAHDVAQIERYRRAQPTAREVEERAPTRSRSGVPDSTAATWPGSRGRKYGKSR